jgi:DNA-binding NarL/FixJ family response regulator
MIRILLVEDNVIVRRVVKELIALEDTFLVVGTAESGQIALEMLRNGLLVDVVVTDLDMPGMSGIELTQEILNLSGTLKVIILTMHDKQLFLLQALAAGAAGYLLKNGDMDELYTSIKAVFNGGIAIGRGVQPPDLSL